MLTVAHNCSQGKKNTASRPAAAPPRGRVMGKRNEACPSLMRRSHFTGRGTLLKVQRWGGGYGVCVKPQAESLSVWLPESLARLSPDTNAGKTALDADFITAAGKTRRRNWKPHFQNVPLTLPVVFGHGPTLEFLCRS